MTYFRPLVQIGRDRADNALGLAGGWCWFHQVMVHARDAAPHLISATELPIVIRDRLTRPRSAIAGMKMDLPRVMGILNVTPDSFSDGGLFDDADIALRHALAMQAAGADIIDIGGESTRPGAADVTAEAEITRTVPVIKAIRSRSTVPISIDTRKSMVAKAAVGAGANMVNDVAAFSYDPQLGHVTAEANLPVCLMHAQGDPATMQQDPHYDDVLLDVYDFLEERISFAEALGIARDQIVIDPGIGFGKTLEHNLALLRGIAIFHSLGCPILLGASRKRFIGTIACAEAAVDRVSGSVAVALHGARQGVQILRVHDTFETRQALDLELAINGAAT